MSSHPSTRDQSLSLNLSMRPKKMLKRLILSFEHRPCDTRVDVYVSRDILNDGNAAIEAAVAKIGMTCPTCKAPMPYDGFLFETAEEITPSDPRPESAAPKTANPAPLPSEPLPF